MDEPGFDGTGTGPPADAGLTPSAYYESAVGDTRQVVYMTANGHIHELSAGVDEVWTHTDLPTAKPTPRARSPATALRGIRVGVAGEPDRGVHGVYGAHPRAVENPHRESTRVAEY